MRPVELSTDIVVPAQASERPLYLFAHDERRIRALVGPTGPAGRGRDAPQFVPS